MFCTLSGGHAHYSNINICVRMCLFFPTFELYSNSEFYFTRTVVVESSGDEDESQDSGSGCWCLTKGEPNLSLHHVFVPEQLSSRGVANSTFYLLQHFQSTRSLCRTRTTEKTCYDSQPFSLNQSEELVFSAV